MSDIDTMVGAATKLAVSQFGKTGEIGDMERALYACRSLRMFTKRDAALEIIRHLGTTFATEDPEEAVTALGKVCAYVAIYARFHRLDVEPILDLARALCTQGWPVGRAVNPQSTVAALAMDRGRYAFDVVEALAYAVAKALIDCEMIHDLKIDPCKLLIVVGNEMIRSTPKARADVRAGGLPTASGEPEFAARVTRVTASYPASPAGPAAPTADADLRDGVDLLMRSEASEPGDFDVQVIRCALCSGDLARHGDGYRCALGHVVAESEIG